MGNLLSNDDSVFRWEYTDQPHADRRLEILRKHPEIKQYMKANGDPFLAVIALFLIILHIFLGYLTYCALEHYSYVQYALPILVGSFIASWLTMSLHEAAHNLVFGPCRPGLNRLFGILVNLALVLPFYAYFKRHHKRHHKHLGHEELDSEYPTALEARLFSGHCLTKFMFLIYNPILQHLRTVCKSDGSRDWFIFEEMTNNISCVLFSLALFRLGYGFLWIYFAMSSFTALGTNLFGIWGMAVHCLFFDKYETLSYYGWMNVMMLNFGYHMEHHDFPNVPCRFLPEIRRIAPEYYEDHHHLDSLYSAVLQWLHDPRLGVFSRLKRDNPLLKIQKRRRKGV